MAKTTLTFSNSRQSFALDSLSGTVWTGASEADIVDTVEASCNTQDDSVVTRALECKVDNWQDVPDKAFLTGFEITVVSRREGDNLQEQAPRLNSIGLMTDFTTNDGILFASKLGVLIPLFDANDILYEAPRVGSSTDLWDSGLIFWDASVVNNLVVVFTFVGGEGVAELIYVDGIIMDVYWTYYNQYIPKLAKS